MYSSMEISMIIVAVSLSCVSANCMPSYFRLLNKTLIEASEGFSLLLECSIERADSTVFNGNLMNCSESNNEIILLHSRFNTTTGMNGTCNNENILGYSLPINNQSNCYTSWLCITTSPDMVGKTVRCARDNGTAVEVIGTFTIPPNTTMTPPTATTQGDGSDTSDPPHTHIQATNSLSSGEIEAIIICCSLFLVGIMIIMIILLIFGFVFKKKHLQTVQTLNSTHIDEGQQARSTFHRAQNDEVSGYTLRITDYDHIIIVTDDDSEYSRLQHPGPQHALPRNDT